MKIHVVYSAHIAPLDEMDEVDKMDDVDSREHFTFDLSGAEC